MANNFLLITLAVTCIFVQTTHAASFECADEPAVCKIKFATQFENDFNDIQLNAIQKFMNAYIDMGNIIKSEVPENSPQVKYMLDHINKMHSALEKIHGNVGDIKKFVEHIKATTQRNDSENVPSTVDLNRMIEKHGFSYTLFDILRKMGADTGNLWAEMYKGLREKDLTTYPEYAEVNGYMEKLKAADGSVAADFMQAAEILGEKFNLPYFAEMKEFEKM